VPKLAPDDDDSDGEESMQETTVRYTPRSCAPRYRESCRF
jgi:hypothetical protein